MSGGAAISLSPGLEIADSLVVAAALSVTTAVGAAITAFILLSIERDADAKDGGNACHLKPCPLSVKAISRR